MTADPATLATRRPPAVPAGTRLIHIGPPKTGTTAIQAAFHLARAAAAEQGVHYAGYGRHSASEVRAVVGVESGYSEDRSPPSIRLWNRLAREIRASRAPRVVLSSEEFTHAGASTIARVISDLGDPPVHVVVTLRPLARLLPSQWQQGIQSGKTEAFDSWLRETLADPHDPRSSFWLRHRHDALVERWAGVVGAEHVTVIVLDGSNHALLYRAFEDLVALEPGTLVPDPELCNRSLTVPEIEVLRAFNVLWKQEHLPRPLHTRVVRRGVAPLLERRTPESSATRLALPPWAAPLVEGVARDIVDGIAASGVQVVGDLGCLLEVTTRADDAPQDSTVSPEMAAAAMMGILVATGAVRGAAGSTDGGAPTDVPIRLARPYGEPPELFRVATPYLALALLRRLRGAAFDRAARLTRWRGGSS